MLKVGDSVVCIDNVINGGRMINLTYGEVYTLYRIVERTINDNLYTSYRIVDDLNDFSVFDSRRFINVCDYRNDIIDEILA